MTRSSVLTALSPLLALVASCGMSSPGESATGETSTAAPAAPEADTGSFAVADLARFNEPWAMAFLPDGARVLVTEKSGKLKLWQDGRPVQDVAGAPVVAYGGQGGLGDVILSPRFADDGVVYLSWAEAGPDDTRGAAVGKARLVLDGSPRLEGLQVLWRQSPKVTGRGHYSHRMAFSPDGQYLFIASGDRQKMAPAQDMSGNLGKIVRLLPDGTPAPGNPFAASGGVAAQVWSLGHRNVLGLHFDADGQLWDLEHGPAGGDELNRVQPGKNYGWPVVSNGDHYDGTAIPRHATRPDFAAPALSWNPVIAPGDFLFYRGDLFPGWKGQAIVAGMGYPGLVRVQIDGTTAREVERIPLGNRIREVREAADGSLWVLEDGAEASLRRITPRHAPTKQ